MTAPLAGKTALILGIANAESIAYGCARALKEQGARLAITYQGEKARRFVEPCAEALEAEIFLPCDVQQAGQLEAVFAAVGERWGRLDIALHSIAFAPKEDLHGRLVDASAAGFALAMDVSCHSFLRMARLAEPLMSAGGTLFTMSFLGAQRVVKNYNLMGPVKAALEASVRYLATELGPGGIRVHGISPGPVRTRAASGLKEFTTMFDEAERRAPLGRLATPQDVGALVAFLAQDGARTITGETLYVDGGSHIMG
jgi:enoyl-[acyl-carrier protein] reductase I